jgi:hypothetical protein
MNIYLSAYGEAPWVFSSSKRLALGTNKGQFVPWVGSYYRAREYLAMNKLVERAYTRRMVMLPCLGQIQKCGLFLFSVDFSVMPYMMFGHEFIASHLLSCMMIFFLLYFV